MFKKTMAGTIVAAGLLLGAAGTAGADHGHFVLKEKKDGTTECRYVAHGQTSKGADEPGGHKFHDNVHNGQPGSDDKGNDVDKSANEDERCDTTHDRGSKGQAKGRG